jgi:hypothetical protein
MLRKYYPITLTGNHEVMVKTKINEKFLRSVREAEMKKWLLFFYFLINFIKTD